MTRSGRVVGFAKAHTVWVALSAVVVAAAAGTGIYFAVAGGGAEAASTTTKTTVETVSTGTIRQSVSATGTLAPTEDKTLTFSSSGLVTSVLVAQGQSVTAGQRLATINSAALAATVAQANATVASDQAKVSDDQTNGVSATQLAADQAALTAAQNQLASAQSALAGATLLSPITGVVANVGLTVGESVSGSGSSGSSGSSGGTGGSGSGSGSNTSTTSSSSSTGSIEVISTNSWIVNASVDSASVGLIKAGDQAQLVITGATATQYGTISSIAILSSSTSGTASYPVVIGVTGAPAGLHDGASVTATLIYKQLSDVIVVPATAIHRTTSGTYVDKMVNGKAVQTTVGIGIASGAEVQITSGLAAGDQIQVTRITTTGTGTSGTTRTRTGTGTGGYGNGGTGGYGRGTGGGTGGGTGNGSGGFGGAPAGGQ